MILSILTHNNKYALAAQFRNLFVVAIGVGKVSDLADHCIRHLPLPVAGFATTGIGQTVSEPLFVNQSLVPLIQHGVHVRVRVRVRVRARMAVRMSLRVS